MLHIICALQVSTGLPGGKDVTQPLSQLQNERPPRRTSSRPVTGLVAEQRIVTKHDVLLGSDTARLCSILRGLVEP